MVSPISLSLVDLWGSHSETMTILLTCVAIFAVVQVQFYCQRPDNSKIHDLGGFPMLSAWLFFTERDDFMCRTFKRTGQSIFRFRVLQHHVVALSGEDGRKLFFSEKNLNMDEGYKILGGPIPRPEDINLPRVEDASGPFVKHVLSLFRKDRLVDVLPHLLEDINRCMNDWGQSGTIDPFRQIHDLVFQMTVRMGSCRELADNAEALSKLSEFFLLHEQSASALSLMLPWLPGRAKRSKQKATRGLYETVGHYVDLRRKAAVQSSDAIDMLISQGFDDATTVAYTVGIIFAGVINTAMNVCWVIIYLGDKPKWKAKLAAEVKALLAHSSAAEAAHQRLAAVPLNVWEDEMPILDAVLKETMRFTTSRTVLRRNIGGDLLFAHKRIKDSDFVTYSLSDTHFDGDIYPDPYSFDPGRFLARDDKTQVMFPFLGWGAGRHPCAGMRAAKLEIKLAIALFFCKFEYDIVDANGHLLQSLPRPDPNNFQSAKPLPGNACYVRYREMRDQ
ncbi:cytochrome P450 [Mycena amicta]|nr:cytochrome P450 [Mycena amicta]